MRGLLKVMHVFAEGFIPGNVKGHMIIWLVVDLRRVLSIKHIFERMYRDWKETVGSP